MVQLQGRIEQPIQGLDNFNDVVTQSFCPMSCTSIDKDVKPDLFRGKLDCSPLNRIQIAKINSTALDVQRSTKDIAKISGDAYFLVKFQLYGQGIVRQMGREARLNPGDFVLCSSSEPYNLHFPSDYQQAVLSIPQSLLREMFQVPDDYLGLKMNREVPIHGILSQFVNSLVQRMDLLEPATVQRLEANIMDLLITSLEVEGGSNRPASLNAADKHLQHIKQFISLHLKDGRLSPDFIAQAEGISKRYLHKLFMDESVSISRYIQLRRLEECKRILSNPMMQHLSATEIALDCGFGDISHFHRCFKGQYKITPRQFRIQAINS